MSGLQKVIVPIDLSAGLNEKDRPESLDAAKSLTVVENLVQDQSGAWVKRPGTRLVEATGADTEGNAYSKLRACFRTATDGLAFVGNGKLYQFLETSAGVRNAGQTCEASLTSSLLTGASTVGLQALSAAPAVILAAASNSSYDAVAYWSHRDTAGVLQSVVGIYERHSGALVASYTLAVPSGTTTPISNVQLAFVGTDYLHVWWANGASNLYSCQVDTTAAFPSQSTFTAAAYDHGALSATTDLSDIAATDTRSIVCCGSTGLFAYTTTLTADSVVTARPARSCSLDDSGLLWVSGSGAGGNVQITAYTASALTDPATYDWEDPAVVASTNQSLVARPDGTILLIDNTLTKVTPAATALGFDSVGLNHMVIYETSDPTDIALVATWGADSSGVGAVNAALHGWMPFSRPFYVAETDKVYIHLVKQAQVNSGQVVGSTLQQHVVVCLDDHWFTYDDNGADTRFVTVRPVATLEAYLGLTTGPSVPVGIGSVVGGACSQLRYLPRSSEVCALTPVLVAARTAVGGLHRIFFNGARQFTAAQWGLVTQLSAACPQEYDGRRSSESGFVDSPCILQADNVAGGVLEAKTYNYIAVYRHVSRSGAVSYSKVSNVRSVASAANRRTWIVVPLPSVTAKNDSFDSIGPSVVVDLFRTQGNGTNYYLCATSEVNPGKVQAMSITNGYAMVRDDASDASLVANGAFMYRQPGGISPALDRFPPPGGSTVMCAHKDRLFYADSYGQRVFYSSFMVDGEAPWFNSQLSFLVPGGSGPITGLCSMDGRLLIFKRDSVFVVDGDGPPENGGNGSEFTPPSKLSAPYGALDQRSIVLTPRGVCFVSQRGLELMDRSLNQLWIGEAVQVTTGLYPVCTGAVVDSVGRVKLCLSAAETDALQHTSGNEGVVLVADMSGTDGSIVFSTCSYNLGADGQAMQSSCKYAHQGTDRVVYVNYQDFCVREDDAWGKDYVTYRGGVLTTGWLKLGMHQRQRIYDIHLLLKQVTDSKSAIKLSLSYDYDDTVVQTKTFEPSDYAGTVVSLNLNPARQTALAVKLAVEDQAAADTGTYPTGNGQGLEVLGVSFTVGPKTGPNPVPLASKG